MSHPTLIGGQSNSSFSPYKPSELYLPLPAYPHPKPAEDIKELPPLRAKRALPEEPRKVRSPVPECPSSNPDM